MALSSAPEFHRSCPLSCYRVYRFSSFLRVSYSPISFAAYVGHITISTYRSTFPPPSLRYRLGIGSDLGLGTACVPWVLRRPCYHANPSVRPVSACTNDSLVCERILPTFTLSESQRERIHLVLCSIRTNAFYRKVIYPQTFSVRQAQAG